VNVGKNSVVLSVVIPVYNAQTTLSCTLESLESIDPQHRGAVEVIVVNDGSTDGSQEMIDRAADMVDGFQWQRLSKPNGGLSSARNTALSAAHGEWVFFLDSDDELVCDLVPILAENSGQTSVALAVEHRRHGRRWRRIGPRLATSGNWLDLLSSGNPFTASSLVFKRECVEHPFDVDVDVVNDWLFWLKNHQIFRKMKAVDRVVAHIHIHGNSMSSQYARAGRYRSLVAERAAALYADRLTRKQMNNLFLQNQIGKLQRQMRIPPSAFLSLPCDPLLYSKFWVYAVSSLCGFKATPYQALFR